MKRIKSLRKYAENMSKEIYTEMPQGFKLSVGALTAPFGLEWIHNGKGIPSHGGVSAFVVNKRDMLILLKEDINDLDYFEKKTDGIYKEWMGSPTSKELEEKFDSAYKQEFAAFEIAKERLALLAGLSPKECHSLLLKSNRGNIWNVLKKGA